MPKVKRPITETINELSDYQGTLDDFVKIAQKAAEKYGGNTVVKFDAGYNNVDVVVEINE